MADAVSIALIGAAVALASTVSPLLLAHLTNRARRQERLEDYARQDMVATRAAEAARLLVVANERVAATSKVTHEKLDEIHAVSEETHALVNSDKTARMQSELEANVRTLAMMREVIALKEAAGREPSIEALAAVKSTEDKIAELTVALKDRLTQTKTVEQH